MSALKNCLHDKSEHTKNIDGYWVCRACSRERARARRKNNPRVGRGINNSAKTHCPKKHKYTPDNTYIWQGRRHCRKCAVASRRRILLKSYGLTSERWDELVVAQSGLCAVCPAQLFNPHIDHDHSCCPGRKSCGKCVRGILCPDCNKMLGYAHDDTAVLLAAVEYIETYTGKQSTG